MTHHTFNVDHQPAFEIGASLYALVAYPAARDRTRRNHVQLALGRQYLDNLNNAEPDLRLQRKALYPAYLSKPVRYSIEKLPERLRDSHIVGAVILSMVKKQATGLDPILPQGYQRASWTALLPLFVQRRPDEAEEAYVDRIEMFHRRQKRARFEGAHLAAAFLMESRTNPEMEGLSLDDLAAFRRIVENAKFFQLLIEENPALARQASKLATLEWIER